MPFLCIVHNKFIPLTLQVKHDDVEISTNIYNQTKRRLPFESRSLHLSSAPLRSKIRRLQEELSLSEIGGRQFAFRIFFREASLAVRYRYLSDHKPHFDATTTVLKFESSPTNPDNRFRKRLSTREVIAFGIRSTTTSFRNLFCWTSLSLRN
jgi:hypothetical protein